jgi:hypothetical protein
MIRRFSSRRERLDDRFLNERLRGARRYDRIAGYFSSGVLEVAGEALESVSEKIRVVCNSELDPRDVQTARAAMVALRQEWCAWEPERLAESGHVRFQKLFELLRSELLQVRVLPSEFFGLIHGKAGVITLDDGSKTAFLGSANESRYGWSLHYELLWEDDSEDAVTWVQEEFDALWTSPHSVPLAEFVIQDIGRLARRTVLPGVEDWRQSPKPAATVVEAPVYRRENGLWAHQKHFVKLAFEAHRTAPEGARFVLADTVGLGKTVQLALAGMLMALEGEGPVLVLAPKALAWQWQDELRELLDLPSAVWTSRGWVDEHGILHPAAGPHDIRRCPRRFGIVSQGLVTAGSEAVEFLLPNRYDCVIVDEAHRARRKNLGPGRENEAADPNNLLAYLHRIAGRARNLLLATATPVQLYPIEAWDLLSVLAEGNDAVLGNEWSQWRRHPGDALDLATGSSELGAGPDERWEWIRNPLPPSAEGRDFALLRASLGMSDNEVVAAGDALDRLRGPDRSRLTRVGQGFGRNHNPFIRRIVRRTRGFLENTRDPETGEPFLKPVRVELFGEDEREAIPLPPYLNDAYGIAEEFTRSLANRVPGGGFLKTLLLRRAGSTMHAGAETARKLLGEWTDVDELDGEEDVRRDAVDELRTLTPSERNQLERFLAALEANIDRDPKYAGVVEYLLDRDWLELGCIVFSQYFDSVRWLADELTRDPLPDEPIAIYAGGDRSGIMRHGIFNRASREDIKAMVRHGELRLVLGTDAASEGLNLQKLGTLINLDLPWNPTRLEQRKGRIQRIGQLRDTVFVYNMRYRGSVEDRVHELLSARLENLHELFGQLPDVLEDVWVEVALGKVEKARQTIGAVPQRHPFELRYQRHVEPVNWESCAEVLNPVEQRLALQRGWSSSNGER